MDSCSLVRVIVLDISGTRKHFEALENNDTVLDEGGLKFAPLLNVILSHHEGHGFDPSQMGGTDTVVQAVFDHLLYEFPMFIDSVPFDITDQVKAQIKSICELFSLALNECKLKGRGWSVVGYRSTYHPIIGKVLQ